MQSNFSPEEPGLGLRESLPLSDAVREITNEYELSILQTLRDQGVAPEYIAVFHVEPRGDSFLAGFRVGVSSGEEFFIYAEPSYARKISQEKDDKSGKSEQISVWQYPFDPKLKSLASLAQTEPLRIIFSRLGLPFVPSHVELLTYRPGRRAMVKCSGGSESAFVKALRPSRVERVVSATQLAKNSGILAPRVLGWSPDGFAIFEALEGIELSRLSGGKTSGAAVIKTSLDSLANFSEVKTDVPSRTPIIDNYEWYFSKAFQAHPDEKSELKKLEQKIGAIKAGKIDRMVQTTIHGDFHLGQVLVSKDDHSSVSGVIDLDDMGTGFAADDVAALWSNCVASGRLNSNDEELRFWRECISELELTQLVSSHSEGYLHGSIAVHLVAQTLSTRGLNPAVAHPLIRDAATILG